MNSSKRELEEKEQKMVKKVVNFDGKKNGIIVKLIDEDGNGHYFMHRNDQGPFLFTNMESAKIVTDVSARNDYKQYFICLEDMMYPIDDCLIVGNEFHVINNNEYIIAKQVVGVKLVSAGYFVFENGDIERSDREYGTKRQKELFNTIRKAATRLMYNVDLNDGNYHVNFMGRGANKDFRFKIKDSTAEIHVITNSHLMDYNQMRKENNQRVLPFLKNMDKYLTFYVYGTKNANEPKSFIINELKNGKVYFETSTGIQSVAIDDQYEYDTLNIRDHILVSQKIDQETGKPYYIYKGTIANTTAIVEDMINAFTYSIAVDEEVKYVPINDFGIVYMEE